MYLKKIQLQNIKCFEDVTLAFPVRDGNYGGWNVILGENGRGKSTLLRSVALGVLDSRLIMRQGAEILIPSGPGPAGPGPDTSRGPRRRPAPSSQSRPRCRHR